MKLEELENCQHELNWSGTAGLNIQAQKQIVDDYIELVRSLKEINKYSAYNRTGERTFLAYEEALKQVRSEIESLLEV